MEKLLMFMMICVFAKAMENRNHTKLVRAFEKYPEEEPVPHEVQEVNCTSCTIVNERYILTKEANCGEPKKVFYNLGHLPRGTHEEIYPKAVWVKQCIGVCTEDSLSPNKPCSLCSKCTPGKTVWRDIPLRIVNHQTSQEECAIHPFEEHESCKCAADSHKHVKSKIAVF